MEVLIQTTSSMGLINSVQLWDTEVSSLAESRERLTSISSSVDTSPLMVCPVV